MPFDRRRFLQTSAGAFAAALSGPLAFLRTKQLQAAVESGLCGTRGPSPYGEPVPATDMATGLDLIMLPPGFTYTTFSWNGDLMSDGYKVPEDHDGMAVVGRFAPGKSRKGQGSPRQFAPAETVLIRNHEVSSGASIALDYNYNPNVGGGTTVLRWRDGQLLDSRVSVSGTNNNCAGGPTPWGTWLTCEETLATVNGIPHGYCFESLPFESDAERAAWGSPIPLVDMGRFSHEAIAVDPKTGFVYETEDESTSSSLIDAPGASRQRGNSGFYMFVPANRSGKPGSLEAGGKLFMLQAIDENGQAVADLRDPACYSEYDVEWIEIEQPNSVADGRVSGPFYEGYLKGATRFQRLEGCWWDPIQEVVVFVDTEGGPIGAQNGRDDRAEGAVWVYDPKAKKLINLFVSQGALAPEAYGADNPDNVSVSPRGGIVMCEDGGTDDGNGLSMLGLLGNGQSFEFARNIISFSPADVQALTDAGRDPALIVEWVSQGNYSGQEWAGATFDPSGEWLFANIQTPGITFAITGPWENGPF